MTNEEVLRALFAGLALQGVLAGGVCNTRVAPRVAVELADDLLDELYADDDMPAEEAGIAAINKRRK